MIIINDVIMNYTEAGIFFYLVFNISLLREDFDPVFNSMHVIEQNFPKLKMLYHYSHTEFCLAYSYALHYQRDYRRLGQFDLAVKYIQA